ncbi:tautomerase family protein [Actinomadura rugatobispora]|uniref:4-oxalocrotonate tautomerase family protein n=1 Tax=Actinomadura rugatobispora TaxID=1994 RepID=A0ABW0ZQY2_9ACTN|nr:hypothetical protein GCM10010200_093290 [Actinomadura rugatobispora]
MPIIDVSLLAGRSEGDLRRLMRALHETTVEVLGAPPESVRVLIREIPPAHWSSGGVTMAEKAADAREKAADGEEEKEDGDAYGR